MRAIEPRTLSSVPFATPPLRVQKLTLFFAVGDLVFLIAVGVVSTLVMQGIHHLAWNFAVTIVVGMAAAMVAQMLMAFCVAPLLGSIETMTPSMPIGMAGPMAVCALHVIGHETDLWTAVVVGAIFGGAMFAFVQIYAVQVKWKLNRPPFRCRGA